MPNSLTRFLLHWAITSLSLWAASYVFAGIHFADASALVISALLLGFANAIVRPLLIILTLPLTVLTLGFFLLVVNALMLLLVSALVTGFSIASFWTAFFASIFISVLSFVIGAVLGGSVKPR
jgi:putative membrane protein